MAVRHCRNATYLAVHAASNMDSHGPRSGLTIGLLMFLQGASSLLPDADVDGSAELNAFFTSHPITSSPMQRHPINTWSNALPHVSSQVRRLIRTQAPPCSGPGSWQASVCRRHIHWLTSRFCITAVYAVFCQFAESSHAQRHHGTLPQPLN